MAVLDALDDVAFAGAAAAAALLPCDQEMPAAAAREAGRLLDDLRAELPDGLARELDDALGLARVLGTRLKNGLLVFDVEGAGWALLAGRDRTAIVLRRGSGQVESYRERSRVR